MQRSKKFVYDYLAELSQGDNLCRVHNISGISLCLCIVQPSPNHLRRPRGSNSGRDGTKNLGQNRKEREFTSGSTLHANPRWFRFCPWFLRPVPTITATGSTSMLQSGIFVWWFVPQNFLLFSLSHFACLCLFFLKTFCFLIDHCLSALFICLVVPFLISWFILSVCSIVKCKVVFLFVYFRV